MTAFDHDVVVIGSGFGGSVAIAKGGGQWLNLVSSW